ncbi:MAG: hypothetical protein FWD61_15450 [Phycisphaerales bacterium]|nr:hypothetical protein [Phycisphaerales bacterium]
MRQILDGYLDGQLMAGEEAELKERLAKEPVLARTLKLMAQERALRAATFESFNASEREGEIVAAKVIATVRDIGPIGYVGVWVRRVAAVAAILVIVGGSYVLGVKCGVQGARAEKQVVVRVMYYDDLGEKQVAEFNSLDAADAFINRADVRRGSPDVQIADMDVSRSGTF